jgi:alanine racemase
MAKKHNISTSKKNTGKTRNLNRREFFKLSALSTGLIASLPLGLSSKAAAPLSISPLRSSTYDPWIELNLDALNWNLKKIRELTKVQVMAVIKANAYGHGLVDVAQALERKRISFLMVGKLQEAFELRENGITSPIFNFGPFSAQEAKDIIRYQIQQSVFTEEVEALDEAARQSYQKALVHIHIDTGMGRAGVDYRHALPYLEKVATLKGITIAGVSTTLTEDPEFDRLQLQRFQTVCRQAEEKGLSLGLKHVASSSGLLTLPEAYLDMVRPGIMLYGYYPSDKTQAEDKLHLRPVLSLKCRVYAVKTFQPGDSISYHRAYKVTAKEKIALLPIGYSDGYPLVSPEKSLVLIKGKKFPIITSPTANHLEVRLGHNTEVKPGDEVVLIGRQKEENISAFDLSQWAKISVYKVLINLNPRLPRRI